MSEKKYSDQLGGGQIHMMHIFPVNDELHSHAFFELVYVVGGRAVHYLGTESMELRQGDYFIIDTGSLHCYRDTENFEIVNCLFLPQYVDRALVNCPSLSALLSNQVMRFGVPVDIRTADRIFRDSEGRVLHLIRAMEAEYAAKQTGFMELLRCYLTQILVYAVRASDLAEKKRTAHPVTAAMAQHLRSHYAQPLSLEALSRDLSYSPQYLSSLFRQDTGMTLREYLQRLRVEQAASLLERGESVEWAAQAVGYSDVKHFSRVFRLCKGVSPREFRKDPASLG